ncbi:HIT family protein [Streptomyces spiramyceticus]|uniref:HIT family protein n=1 Tax=Streptomyces spiramyceticus TaxID=299717 RepID=UPI00237B1C9B|nr:hypothetical protein [Streptomyces spiramyceticus]
MTTTPAAPQPGSDAFVARLPIGESLPIPDDSLVTWDIFPLEGEMRVKPLQAPVLPEPPRNGEDGPEGCDVCDEPLEDALWADEHWRVDAATDPSGLPALVQLKPRGHYDLSDLPPERAAEIGPMLQRVERAIMSLGGIARVHINKWGDGGAHLHFWLLGRPAGMMQLRGTVLSIWDDLLPHVPDGERHLANRRIAAALATDGGKAYAL